MYPLGWVFTFVVVIAGCVASSAVPCGDGVVCPSGTSCVALGESALVCATQEQLAACDGIDDGASCSFGDAPHVCLGGACMPTVCGDGRVDPSEACDDGDTISGSITADGYRCSATCQSDERCGNGIVDPVVLGPNDETLPNEECDDGNLTSGDGCSSTCLREALRWTRVDAPIPKLESYGIAYDSARQRIVLFGGIGEDGVYSNDVYEWTGTSWVMIDSLVKPQRRAHAMLAYDAARRRVVMFGGNGGNGDYSYGDTWEWDGERWELKHPATAPHARSLGGMVYDGARKRVVLFGGWNIHENFDDTWEWDGENWTQLQTTGTPPARHAHVMAYDPRRGVTVIAGGTHRSGSLQTPTIVTVRDTWELDGTTWRESTAPPATLAWGQSAYQRPGTSLASMTYDPTMARLIVYAQINEYTARMYAYDGTSWTDLTAANPVFYRNTKIVTDARAQSIYYFGGRLGSSEALQGSMFRFAGDSWALVNSGARPPERGDHAAAYDPVRGVTWTFGGRNSGGNLAQFWTFDGASWQGPTATGSLPAARRSAMMAFDEKRDEVVLFGGEAANAPTNTTYVFTPSTSTWTLKTPAQSPPVRMAGAMAYDARRERVVLFGGMDSSNATNLGDTWEWDGTTWTEVAMEPTATKPAARLFTTMAYDPVAQHVVLHGGFELGFQAAVPFSDLWAFDGSSWTELSAGTQLSSRLYPSIAFDRTTQQLVMFGGIAAAGLTTFDDTWLWDGDWRQQVLTDAPPGRAGAVSFPALTGSGVMIYGGWLGGTNFIGDVWRLRWESDAPLELCTLPIDKDGDGKVGCEDEDCAVSCERCGDGVCSAQETCRICPADCSCTAVCGDFFCDVGETQASCPGDCTP